MQISSLINSVSLSTVASVIDSLISSKNVMNVNRALVVIDAGVDDYEFLIRGVLSDADVMLLDRHRNGIAQIGEVLRAGDFSVLQILNYVILNLKTWNESLMPKSVSPLWKV